MARDISGLQAQSQKSNPARRVVLSKTRTGCQTCKKRHLRCDETKPQCLRCKRLGWQCEYVYSFISRNIVKEVPPQPSDHDIHHFVKWMSNDLGAIMSVPFWTKFVLQLSFQQPVIKDLLVAIATLHENSLRIDANPRKGDGIEAYRRTSLELINKSIRNIASTTSKLPLFVVIVAAILLSTFDRLTYDFNGAVRHLRNASNLLKSSKSPPLNGRLSTWEQDIIETEIRPLLQPNGFRHQDEQTAMPTEKQEAQDSKSALDTEVDIPPVFSGFLEAHSCLSSISKWLIKALNSLEHSNSFAKFYSVRQRGNDMMQQWFAAWHVFEQKSVRPGSESAQIAGALIADALSLALVIKRSLIGDEMGYDDDKEIFSKIITLCLKFLSGVAPKLNSPTSCKPSLGSPVLVPMTFVACRCRDPALRRQAIHFMRTDFMVQKSPLNKLLATVFETKMLEEESGCGIVTKAQDIPRHKRLRIHDWYYYPRVNKVVVNTVQFTAPLPAEPVYRKLIIEYTATDLHEDIANLLLEKRLSPVVGLMPGKHDTEATNNRLPQPFATVVQAMCSPPDPRHALPPGPIEDEAEAEDTSMIALPGSLLKEVEIAFQRASARCSAHIWGPLCEDR